MAKEKILITIAARGGSKGVANKNIRLLCGIPLIAHTIKQAKQWGKADAIVCSTDSEEIAAIARQYGAEVPFMRPAELSTDTVGKLDVLKHAVRTVEEQQGSSYQIVVDLDVTAPVRTIEDIEGSLRLFKQKKPKTVITVTPSRKNPYFNMVEIGPAGYVTRVKEPEKGLLRRQDAPPVYDMNASIYVYDRKYLLDEKTTRATSDRSLAWIMDEFSAFDIDSETDFQFIEFLVTKGLVTL